MEVTQKGFEDVLYRMNSEGALKKKVYQTLADYSSDTIQRVMDSLFPPVKKVILIFDEKGDNVAALETDMDSGSGVYPYGGYPNNMWAQYAGMAAPFAAPETSGAERHKWRYR